MADSLTRLETALNESRQQQSDVKTISDRLDTLERSMQQQQAQIAALSASLEKINRKRTTVQPRKKATTKHKAADKPRVTPIQPPKKPAVVTSPQPQPQQHVEKEKNDYTAAYLALKSGRYEEASKTFSAQLHEFPKGEYADQAWYWLGESQYAQDKQKQALQAFLHVVDNYPESIKHATALLRLGQIYQTMQQPKKARKYFEQLIARHADSNAAEQARSLLSNINHQGE